MKNNLMNDYSLFQSIKFDCNLQFKILRFINNCEQKKPKNMTTIN